MYPGAQRYYNAALFSDRPRVKQSLALPFCLPMTAALQYVSLGPRRRADTGGFVLSNAAIPSRGILA